MKEKAFETQQDIDNELEVIKKFAEFKNCNYVKMKRFFKVDFALYDKISDELDSLVEIKCTPNSDSLFTNQRISTKKIKAMKEFAIANQCPAYLVYRYSDLTRWADVNDLDGEEFIGGWNKPREGSVNDIEPMWEFPKSQMKIL